MYIELKSIPICSSTHYNIMQKCYGFLLLMVLIMPSLGMGALSTYLERLFSKVGGWTFLIFVKLRYFSNKPAISYFRITQMKQSIDLNVSSSPIMAHFLSIILFLAPSYRVDSNYCVFRNF